MRNEEPRGDFRRAPFPRFARYPRGAVLTVSLVHQ